MTEADRYTYRKTEKKSVKERCMCVCVRGKHLEKDRGRGRGGGVIRKSVNVRKKNETSGPEIHECINSKCGIDAGERGRDSMNFSKWCKML